MGSTFSEKILGVRAGRSVSAGERVTVTPDLIVCHEDAAAVSGIFQGRGGRRVWDPSRVVVVLDQSIPTPGHDAAEAHLTIRRLVKEQGIEHFFDIQHGGCHQLLIERGMVLPGSLIMATDGHATAAGALGALGVRVTPEQAAQIWAEGRLETEVPFTVRVELEGELPEGVAPRDVMFHLAAQGLGEELAGRSLELRGDAVHGMSLGARMALCNMALLLGARTGHVETDGVTLRYLGRRSCRGFEPVFTDADAAVTRTLTIDAAQLVPLTAGPHEPTRISEISSVAGRPVQQAVVGACGSGRVEELWIAASRLRGKQVHPGVRLLVCPATRAVYLEALRLGLISDLVEAGAIVVNPGGEDCPGAHRGALAGGEVCVTTGDDNARGAMGSPEAEVYLASTETVAASAVAGCLADPRLR